MNWEPFSVGTGRTAPRSIHTQEGVGDRLRSAAFAEIQAREAFLWAADRYAEEPEDLRGAWRKLAAAEDRHLSWLLSRMRELGVDVRGRAVSDELWHSLVSCKTARDFALFMASAEERGRRAGERFHEALLQADPETARIFGRIAEEEVAHIELARRFFPS